MYLIEIPVIAVGLIGLLGTMQVRKRFSVGPIETRSQSASHQLG